MPLDDKDRLSMITALMAQDRAEVRERQDAMFKITYSVIPGFIAIGAFSVAQPPLRWVLSVGQVLLLVLYVLAFFTFRRWLADARACLNIRESFYRNPELLSVAPFNPLRPIEAADRSGMNDKHLWFPFGLTVVSGVVMLVYMLVL